MIQATRKTGFLIEDQRMLGRSIVTLRDKAREHKDPELREIANWLDDILVGTYYEPVQATLELEEVAC